MPLSALLSLLLSPPALNHSGLLQFVVFSFWPILKCGNTSPSLLARVFRLWIRLPALSFVLSVIDRPQLVSVMLSPRPLLCVSQEFLVYLCPSSFLLLFLLGIALARQILSLLVFLSPMLPPLDPSPSFVSIGPLGGERSMERGSKERIIVTIIKKGGSTFRYHYKKR